MERFGSLWSDDILVRHSSGLLYGSNYSNYDDIDSVPREVDLQRSQISLIVNSNSARSARGSIAHVHRSVLIGPTTSESMNPVLSSCNNVKVQQSVGPVSGLINVVDSSTDYKDSLDMLDCLFSVTDGSKEDVSAMSPPPMLQNVHSRSFWNFGTGGTLSSGESSENNNSNKMSENNKAKRKNNNPSDPTRPKRTRPGKNKTKQDQNRTAMSSSNISFQIRLGSTSPNSSIDQEPDQEAILQMKEMIYRAAAFRPVNLGLEIVDKPKRKNVRISSDPQTMAARQRRERISERIRVLQRLVPGGTKMDTASMLDEAANYLKFLQSQIKALEKLGPKVESSSSIICQPINNLGLKPTTWYMY